MARTATVTIRATGSTMLLVLVQGMMGACGSAGEARPVAAMSAVLGGGGSVRCLRDPWPMFCDAGATRMEAGLVVETRARAVPVSAGWRVDLQVTLVAADGAVHAVEDEPVQCSGSAVWIGSGLGHGHGCGGGYAHSPITVVGILPGRPWALPGPAEDDCCGLVFAPGWEAELTLTIPPVGREHEPLVDLGPVALLWIRVSEDGSVELSVLPAEEAAANDVAPRQPR